MLTEGRMQDRRGQNSEDLTLARRQALMASGAEGPRICWGPALAGVAYHLAAAISKRSCGGTARRGSGRRLLGARVAPSVDVPRRARRHPRRSSRRLPGGSKEGASRRATPSRTRPRPCPRSSRPSRTPCARQATGTPPSAQPVVAAGDTVLTSNPEGRVARRGRRPRRCRGPARVPAWISSA